MNPRLGFLGLGWIGRHRLASVSNAGIADIIGIADCDAGACQEASRVAPSAKVAHTLDDLLAMPLDGVVIATPSALHAEQARSALSHGVAVFCQKPLARTEEEATAVVRQACRVNRLLGVDLSYRETQAMNVITDLIWSGGIGEIYAADLTFHNAYGPDREWFYDPARSGGGCLIDLGTHLIDLATYVMRRPIVSVSSQLFAAGRRLELPPSEVEDFAIVHGETSDGRVMNVAGRT